MKTRLIKLISSLHSLKRDAQDDADTLNDIQRWLLELTLSSQTGNNADLSKFQRLQDHFDMNLCSALLCWVGRQLVAVEKAQNGLGDEETALRGRMTIALSCIQGLLLLHPTNQKLFRRASSFEYLLTILSTTRPSHLTSPHLSASFSPYPSPILFPSSPSSSKQSSPNLDAPPTPPPSTFTILAVQTLEVILCALVDRPENARCFEDEKGLEAVVKVLKDRKVEGVVRIKAIEILYYYLLPEPSLSPPKSSTSTIPTTPTTPRKRPPLAPLPTPSKLAPLTSFIPQTPQKHAYRHSISTPLATPTSSSSSSTSTTTAAERRRIRHKRNQSSLCGNAGGRGEFVFSSSWREGREGEKTPRAMRGSGSNENESPGRKGSGGLGMSASISGARLFGAVAVAAPGGEGGLKDISNKPTSMTTGISSISEAEGDETPIPKSKAVRRKPVPSYYHDPDETPRIGRIAEASFLPEREKEREVEGEVDMKGRRSEREKKELLRRIMPNVDALQERFKAMGLGVA